MSSALATNRHIVWQQTSNGQTNVSQAFRDSTSLHWAATNMHSKRRSKQWHQLKSSAFLQCTTLFDTFPDFVRIKSKEKNVQTTGKGTNNAIALDKIAATGESAPKSNRFVLHGFINGLSNTPKNVRQLLLFYGFVRDFVSMHFWRANVAFDQTFSRVGIQTTAKIKCKYAKQLHRSDGLISYGRRSLWFTVCHYLRCDCICLADWIWRMERCLDEWKKPAKLHAWIMNAVAWG